MLCVRIFSLFLLLSLYTIIGFGQNISNDAQHAAMFKNGMTQELAGNYTEALKVYRQLANLEPNNEVVLYQQASIAYRLQLLDEAQNILERIVAASTKKEDAYTLLASILVRQGKGKASLRVINRGLEVFPQSGLLYYTKGQKFEREQNGILALEAYADGIEHAPLFAGNYKAASELAQQTPNALWGLIWGETYLLLQPNQTNLQRFRDSLWQRWKEYYDDLQHTDDCNNCTAFEIAFRLESLNTTPITSGGFTRETLIAARKQFTTAWAQNHAGELPFPLFEFHKMLAATDFADVYWQWLFHDGQKETNDANVSKMHAWTKANLPTLDYSRSYLKIKKLKYR
jgi:tetratricopeptide (TPR) repeat protein